MPDLPLFPANYAGAARALSPASQDEREIRPVDDTVTVDVADKARNAVGLRACGCREQQHRGGHRATQPARSECATKPRRQERQCVNPFGSLQNHHAPPFSSPMSTNTSGNEASASSAHYHPISPTRSRRRVHHQRRSDMVFLSRSECRAGRWHVVTYDTTDPDHWVEVTALASEQICSSPAPATIGAPPSQTPPPSKPQPPKPQPPKAQPPAQPPPVSPPPSKPPPQPANPATTKPTAPPRPNIAPGTTTTTATPQPPGTSLKPCRCTKAEEDAELQSMLALYANDVANARANGYQAANDPGYSDPGLGFHSVGNCADWSQVSWSSLVTRTWKCWHVQKIRARRHWTLCTFHHFVRIQSCSGRVIFLDPWSSGTAAWWEASAFPFAESAGWSHSPTHTHQAGDSARDPGND